MLSSAQCHNCWQAAEVITCSAMPTSKVRSAKRCSKRFMPVPPPMAAWMPMMRASLSASAISASAK